MCGARWILKKMVPAKFLTNNDFLKYVYFFKERSDQAEQDIGFSFGGPNRNSDV